MSKISDLFEIYKSLQEDYSLLKMVKRRMTNTLLDTGDVEDVMNHNYAYRHHIEKWIMSHIPETSSDIQKWSEEDVNAWLDFLIAYPALYYEQEEKIIGLFWSLDTANKLVHGEKVVKICVHSSMVDYAADPRHEAVVKTLWVLIDKYATLSQAERFQNLVNLRINENS